MNKTGTDPHAGKFKAVHILVIVLSLTMTFGAYAYSKIQADKQVEARFNAARDQTIGLIVDRMSRYEDALWSGVALADTLDGTITLRDWRSFATSLRIEEKYPGVNGIGVIFKVERGEVDDFVATQAADGWPLNIYPDHRHDPLLPITFILPEDINQQAIGLDVAHEENRRTALLASRDSGTAQITGPIVLVQDSGHTSGFLFYTPFYHGPHPTTLEDRRARFAGVIYAPFVVNKLVQGLLAQDLRPVDFSIRDGDQVIYDEHTGDASPSAGAPMFSDQIELDMYGRTWVIDIRTNAAFHAQNVSFQPFLILLGGLIIEGLIIVMMVMLVRANQNARAYADNLTRELRAKSDHLAKANEEIERFVYVASHDLKTPMRGIRFLADTLEEDLQDAVEDLDNLPDVRNQIEMIRGRVARMQDLAEGIMAFFRVNNADASSPRSIRVSDIVSDCVADFRVNPSQITCDSDVETVTCDPANFRRILENLIGNAFKYHPDKNSAQVMLRIENRGARLQVRVADNGKGIAPKYHQKVFEVFQTLRRPGDPESTGIGLSIVKKAVEWNGGNIFILSEEGAGTAFVFDWPNGSADDLTIEKCAA